MIGQLVTTWINVLTHPSVQTFDAQKTQASRDRTITNIVIAAIVSAVLSFILTLVAAAIFTGVSRGISPGVAPVGVSVVDAIRVLISSLITTVLGFFIFCYVLQFAAERFLGGRGNLDEQSYLISSYWAPISILIAILMFIPCLGWLVALALGIYALMLTTFAVQSGQGIAVGSAVVNWIIAGIVTAIIMGILGALSGGWL